MEPDLWRQWQTFAAQFAPLEQGSAPSAEGPQGRHGAFGFAPFIDSAERFAAEARAFIGSSVNASASSLADGARKFSDFLRDQAAAAQPRWGAAFGIGNPNAANASAQWDLPALGATREYQQRAQRMAEAWRRMDDAQRRLQRLWSDALRDAAATFAAGLGTATPSAPSTEALNKLYDTWIGCAEDAYARTAHSEAFCGALADFANASSQWRGELQTTLEQWAKMLDLPTRSEINALTQRLRSLEERLPGASKPPASSKPPAASKKAKPKVAARGTRRAPRKAKA
ncbi:MAG TPA: poly(R)-hydroxyalkanoic acid synthase subunit PhaE [Steroidobacteraceae bacterium]|nr:poly(R)-hydroxyalkanoic acid synthase subunit PhaE [Steroidobacteraceae bacterium]